MSMKRVRSLRLAGRGEEAGVATALPERIDLGPLPGLIGYVMRRAQVAVFQDFIETFRKVDIRPAQYSVLTVIEHNPGLNQSQLSGVLGIKRANLVGMIDELERRGLAMRKPRPDDRRAHGLFLTDKGVGAMRELHALVREHESRNMRRIGRKGTDQLLLLLRQLYDAEAAAKTDDAE